jgi:hypothetical protein
MVPTDATIGAAIAHLEAGGVRERWQFVGHLAGGGVIAGGGWARLKRLVRALAVERLAEAITRALLRTPRAGGKACGVRLQRALQAFMAASAIADRGAPGPRPARMTFLQERQPLLGGPQRVPTAHREDGLDDGLRCLMGAGAWVARALLQTLVDRI